MVGVPCVPKKLPAVAISGPQREPRRWNNVEMAVGLAFNQKGLNEAYKTWVANLESEALDNVGCPEQEACFVVGVTLRRSSS